MSEPHTLVRVAGGPLTNVRGSELRVSGKLASKGVVPIAGVDLQIGETVHLNKVAVAAFCRGPVIAFAANRQVRSLIDIEKAPIIIAVAGPDLLVNGFDADALLFVVFIFGQAHFNRLGFAVRGVSLGKTLDKIADPGFGN